ncbi:MAG: hypothetical protein GC134_06520 [Proteobacteria bacterium]|nr:hypothetical protein [Pseudomonadota bacterium]
MNYKPVLALSACLLSVTAFSPAYAEKAAQAASVTADTSATQPDAADVCVPLGPHIPRGGSFGMEHWSDDKLRMAANPGKRVKAPEYWVPVGSYRIKKEEDEGCALFPDGQSAVFINPLHWKVDAYLVPVLGIYVVRFIPNTYSDEDVKKTDALIQEVYEKVSYLFPLGLKEYMRQDHHIIVTTGVAGDGKRVENRVFPYPGPHLSVLAGPLGSNFNKEFLIRQAVYLQNKMRPRDETFKDDPLLAAPSWSDMEGGWAAFALLDDAKARLDRVNALYSVHQALTDDDDETWPDLQRYKKIDRSKGPFGMPPNSPRRSAAVKYANSDLGPLIMVALDGLLVAEGKKETMMQYVRLINSKKEYTLPSVMKAALSPKGYSLFEGWMKGQPIDRSYIDKGLARLDNPPKQEAK